MSEIAKSDREVALAPAAARPLRPRASRRREEDTPFIQDLREAMLVQKTPGTMIALYLIAALIVVAIVWAHFAIVEEVTIGEGRVIPASREQVIQSLEGGILEKMNVGEGDVVERGQVLLEIDPKRASAAYREGLSKVLGLKGSIARLRAEAYEEPLEFSDDVKQMPIIVRDETHAYLARQRTLNQSVAALSRSLSLAQKELALSEPLSKKGLISEVEILRMKR